MSEQNVYLGAAARGDGTGSSPANCATWTDGLGAFTASYTGASFASTGWNSWLLNADPTNPATSWSYSPTVPIAIANTPTAAFRLNLRGWNTSANAPIAAPRRTVALPIDDVPRPVINWAGNNMMNAAGARPFMMFEGLDIRCSSSGASFVQCYQPTTIFRDIVTRSSRSNASLILFDTAGVLFESVRIIQTGLSWAALIANNDDVSGYKAVRCDMSTGITGTRYGLQISGIRTSAIGCVLSGGQSGIAVTAADFRSIEVMDSTIHGCGSHGIDVAPGSLVSNGAMRIMNTVVTSCGGWGINVNANGDSRVDVSGCMLLGNVSGRYSNAAANAETAAITGTGTGASQYADVSGGDFRIAASSAASGFAGAGAVGGGSVPPRFRGF